MARALALLGVLVSAVLLLAAPAGAHSETGQMTVITAEQNGPTTVHVEVGITYTDDGHLAEGATVSVTFAGSGGPSLTAPVRLDHVSGGRYGAEVELAPGTWEANIASMNPESSATATVVVRPDFGTTTSAPSTTTTSVPSVITEEADSGTSWTVPVIVVVAVALAIGAAIGVLLAFRKRPPST